jgi:hypothetical protein
MLLKTSTLNAPWTVVEGNDKYYGRVKTLRTLVEAISKELQIKSKDISAERTSSEAKRKNKKAGEKK